MRDLVWLRWWLAGGVVLVALTVYLSLAPNPVTLSRFDCDKCAHFVLYFGLMGWFSGQFRPGRRVYLAIALMLLGVVLEFLQEASGQRMYDLLDMAANAAGIATAWLVARFGVDDWCRWVERRLIDPAPSA